MGELGIGGPAPDGVFLASDGHEVRLSDYWSERPTVFVFLRHFG